MSAAEFATLAIALIGAFGGLTGLATAIIAIRKSNSDIKIAQEAAEREAEKVAVETTDSIREVSQKFVAYADTRLDKMRVDLTTMRRENLDMATENLAVRKENLTIRQDLSSTSAELKETREELLKTQKLLLETQKELLETRNVLSDTRKTLAKSEVALDKAEFTLDKAVEVIKTNGEKKPKLDEGAAKLK